jgi:peptidyl-prolyl cis-trans isomerase NIMA-interacting 1
MMRLFVAPAVVAASLVASCDKQADRPAPPAPPASAAPAPAPAAPPAAVSAVESLPPAFVTAQHLLVAYKGASRVDPKVTRTKEQARKRAQEACDKAKSGSDFSQLVADYSDEPGAAAGRGNLGKFTRDQMVKPFSDAAFALPVSGTSDVVETKFGFHVIKRNQ